MFIKEVEWQMMRTFLLLMQSTYISVPIKLLNMPIGKLIFIPETLYFRYEKFLEHSKTTHAMGRVGSAEEVGKMTSNIISYNDH